MRLHITVEDALVRDLDERAGPRGRSAFIVAALRQALDSERRWDVIEASLGGIDDSGHEWDSDPAAWVRAERRADQRRVG